MIYVKQVYMKLVLRTVVTNILVKLDDQDIKNMWLISNYSRFQKSSAAQDISLQHYRIELISSN